MNDRSIFEYLFKLARGCKDPEGVVVAGLVKNGNVLLSSPSANDGVRHAEDLLLEKANNEGIKIDGKMILFVTLEPCSYRNPENNIQDCTSIILKTGLKNIIFAAPDLEYSKEARKRFAKAGVNYTMVKDSKITRKAIQLFNSTIKIPLNSMQLPRKKKATV